MPSAPCVSFSPDWQEERDAIADPGGSSGRFEATFPNGAELSHRDILGSLMGAWNHPGKLGDILVRKPLPGPGPLRDALPILLSQWESAGRWKAKLRRFPLGLTPKPPQVKTIRDTVAALRLDAVLASGFLPPAPRPLSW